MYIDGSHLPQGLHVFFSELFFLFFLVIESFLNVVTDTLISE